MNNNKTEKGRSVFKINKSSVPHPIVRIRGLKPSVLDSSHWRNGKGNGSKTPFQRMTVISSDVDPESPKEQDVGLQKRRNELCFSITKLEALRTTENNERQLTVSTCDGKIVELPDSVVSELGIIPFILNNSESGFHIILPTISNETLQSIIRVISSIRKGNHGLLTDERIRCLELFTACIYLDIPDLAAVFAQEIAQRISYVESLSGIPAAPLIHIMRSLSIGGLLVCEFLLLKDRKDLLPSISHCRFQRFCELLNLARYKNREKLTKYLHCKDKQEEICLSAFLSEWFSNPKLMSQFPKETVYSVICNMPFNRRKISYLDIIGDQNFHSSFLFSILTVAEVKSFELPQFLISEISKIHSISHSPAEYVLGKELALREDDIEALLSQNALPRKVTFKHYALTSSMLSVIIGKVEKIKLIGTNLKKIGLIKMERHWRCRKFTFIDVIGLDTFIANFDTLPVDELKIMGSPISPLPLSVIIKSSLNYLSKLAIKKLTIPTSIISIVAETISELSKLNWFDISDNRLPSRIILDLLDCLPPSIVHINMSGNNLDRSFIPRFERHLRRFPKLSHFDVSNCSVPMNFIGNQLLGPTIIEELKGRKSFTLLLKDMNFTVSAIIQFVKMMLRVPDKQMLQLHLGVFSAPIAEFQYSINGELAKFMKEKLSLEKGETGMKITIDLASNDSPFRVSKFGDRIIFLV